MKKNPHYEIINSDQWDQSIKNFKNLHFFQTNLWVELKKENGWRPYYLIWKNSDGIEIGGAIVLERTIQILKIITMKILYSPKGPLFNTSNENEMISILKGLKEFSKSRKAIFIKVDPDIVIDLQYEIPEDYQLLQIYPNFCKLLRSEKWVESREQIQFKNTILIDLHKNDDDLLMRMRQKTRYNIRLSEKKGVQVRIGDHSDFNSLFQLYAETAIRDQFIIRSKQYYLRVWNSFYDSGLCEPLIAEKDGEILAAVIIYFYSDRAYYVYGMSSEKNRNLMATYLLQWKAIQRAKDKGCILYDFWGAPNEIDETDRMWGVYKFKLGFNGAFIKTIGAWDFPNNRMLYFMYHLVLPRILSIMRKIGFKRIQEEIE